MARGVSKPAHACSCTHCGWKTKLPIKIPIDRTRLGRNWQVQPPTRVVVRLHKTSTFHSTASFFFPFPHGLRLIGYASVLVVAPALSNREKAWENFTSFLENQQDRLYRGIVDREQCSVFVRFAVLCRSMRSRITNLNV